MSRIDWQLQMTPTDLVAKRVIWVQQHHMGVVDPNHHPEACRLQAAFRANYHLGGEIIIPESYSWSPILLPSPQYPDSQTNEMFDDLTGDPKNNQDPRWTGIDGSQTPHYAEILITLSTNQEQAIDWVALHLLHDETAGVHLPTDLTLFCSPDQSTWPQSLTHTLSDFGLTPSAVQGDKSEYVFANKDPLGWSCRALKLRLANWWWTFLSEIELVKSDRPCGPGTL